MTDVPLHPEHVTNIVAGLGPCLAAETGGDVRRNAISLSERIMLQISLLWSSRLLYGTVHRRRTCFC
jgi:hypothetical protein